MRLQEACQLLQQNDDPSLSLLNLSGQGIGSAGVTKLVDSCCCCCGGGGSGCGQEAQDHHDKKNSSSNNNTNKIILQEKQEQNEALNHHPSLPLVVLWLENNEIYSRGAISLNKLIGYSSHLKYLYMAHNHIGNAGIEAISRTIFQQLQTCNLADNDIGPIGATSIAACLKEDIDNDDDTDTPTSPPPTTTTTTSSPLKTLILESNKLGNDGAATIAEGLKHNTTLLELDLRYNKIGVKGLASIRDALLVDNKTIQSILLEEEEDDGHEQQRDSDDDNDDDTDHSHNHDRRPKKYLKVGSRTRRRCQTQQQLLHSTQCQPIIDCTCKRCKLRIEIEYYLALNRAGRHSFGNMNIHPGLWPRILSRVSSFSDEEEAKVEQQVTATTTTTTTTTATVDGYDRSILFAMLRTRPDMLLKQQKEQ